MYAGTCEAVDTSLIDGYAGPCISERTCFSGIGITCLSNINSAVFIEVKKYKCVVIIATLSDGSGAVTVAG